jgi:hypothetical protein
LREWLARYSDIYDRPIIPIDLRRDDWVVAYNLLRERRAAASVITANMVDALAYVWGAGSTDATPLFARTATMLFRAMSTSSRSQMRSTSSSKSIRTSAPPLPMPLKIW